MTVDITEALSIIGGLSKPSKMPWFSWSISATLCKTGSKLHKVPNSTCHDCYALKGNYRFSNVKQAHERRLLGLKNDKFASSFIAVLTSLYNKSKTYRSLPNGTTIKENRFRWHDSGDLQDTEHLNKIVSIAHGTPFIIHWLPTREIGIVNTWLKQNPDGFPENLIVRISAVMVGSIFSSPPLGLTTSTVGVDDDPTILQCPAPLQDGKCNNCFNCWDKTKQTVNYKQH